MADTNFGEGKAASGCMDRMQEMMRAMMSDKSGLCCPGMEKMAQMMASCCQGRSEQEGPADKTNQKDPK
ncbi:MAG: hypothetical protein P4L43_17750 [Syntrophobacteraceae bacterium]|nr:hypothetical protein [Syntrophobacteraceae bacterium]